MHAASSSSSSCSNYGAAGDLIPRRGRRLPTRSRPTRGKSKVAGPSAMVESRWRTKSSARHSCAAATAFGVSTRLRGDLVVNNLRRSYAVTSGQSNIKSDVYAVASRSSTSKTSRCALLSPSSRRRWANSFTTSRSTSDRAAENLPCPAKSRRNGGRSGPEFEGDLRRRCEPGRRATTASNCKEQDPQSVVARIPSHKVDRAHGRRGGLTTPITRHVHDARTNSSAPRSCA